MTRVNSEVKRSQEPQKKGLTKAEAERRTAHGAVLPVGAAGQRLFSLNNAGCCKLLVPCCIFSHIDSLLCDENEMFGATGALCCI